MSLEHYGDYFGLWAMFGDSFRSAVDRVRSIDLSVHLQTTAPQVAAAAREPQGLLKTEDGRIAIVQLTGTLMKFQSSFGGTSTVQARRQLRQAVADPEVTGILVLLDSPGGHTSGTEALAAEVAKAAAVKPTWSYLEDTCCSAAYWVACRAGRMVTNRMGVVGCIGTYCVLTDSSKRAEREGYTVHVVKAGELKGLGEPGTPVTPEQLAEMQRLVNAVNKQFLKDVQAARKLTDEQLAAVSTGGVWVGEEARAMGLVDAVQPFDETLAQLRTLGQKPNPKSGGKPMSATIGELKAGCPGASNDFLVQQLEAGATLEAAQKAWMAEQNRLLQAANKAAEEARTEAAKASKEATEAKAAAADAGKAKPGVDPLKTKGGGADEGEGGDPLVEFNTLVEAELNSNRHAKRADAVRAVVKKHPKLHLDYLKAVNLAAKRPIPSHWQ